MDGSNYSLSYLPVSPLSCLIFHLVLFTHILFCHSIPRSLIVFSRLPPRHFTLPLRRLEMKSHLGKDGLLRQNNRLVKTQLVKTQLVKTQLVLSRQVETMEKSLYF